MQVEDTKTKSDDDINHANDNDADDDETRYRYGAYLSMLGACPHEGLADLSGSHSETGKAGATGD